MDEFYLNIKTKCFGSWYKQDKRSSLVVEWYSTVDFHQVMYGAEDKLHCADDWYAEEETGNATDWNCKYYRPIRMYRMMFMCKCRTTHWHDPEMSSPHAAQSALWANRSWIFSHSCLAHLGKSCVKNDIYAIHSNNEIIFMFYSFDDE